MNQKLLLELVLDFSMFFLDLCKTALSNFVPITVFHIFLLNQDILENTAQYFCNSFSSSESWICKHEHSQILITETRNTTI